jgi:hypothetical protein
MIKKIIVGDMMYNVIKHKFPFKIHDVWVNFIPCSIKIKMNFEDYRNLKFIVDKFSGNFNFTSLEMDGNAYLCSSILYKTNVTSKIKDDVILKLHINIFVKEKIDIYKAKSLIRNTILDEVLEF